MDIKTFKEKIIENKIPDNWYAINEGIKLDSYILIDNKSYWEFFYFDEKGETSMWTMFDNEDKALDYLWEQIERNIKLFKWNEKK